VCTKYEIHTRSVYLPSEFYLNNILWYEVYTKSCFLTKNMALGIKWVNILLNVLWFQNKIKIVFNLMFLIIMLYILVYSCRLVSWFILYSSRFLPRLLDAFNVCNYINYAKHNQLNRNTKLKMFKKNYLNFHS